MIRRWRAVLLLAGLLAPALALADVARLALDVRLDPASRALQVVAELKSTGEFRFELNRALTIRSASVDGAPAAVELAGSDGELNLWRVPAEIGSTLRIDYAGTLPALDRSLDYRQVLRETRPWSRRRQLSARRRRLVSGLRRAVHLHVRLSLPQRQRGLVPGRLIEEKSRADRYRARFEFDHPAEGISLIAGPYLREKLVARRGAAPLRLRTYFHPDLSRSPQAISIRSQAISICTQADRRYPFSVFSVVSSPLPPASACPPSPTWASMCCACLSSVRPRSDTKCCTTGGATASTPITRAATGPRGSPTSWRTTPTAKRAGPEAARAARLAWLRDYAAMPPAEDRPLARFTSRTHGAPQIVGYDKSAMLFFMLRDLIGEAAFDKGVRGFWRTYRFRIASWDDLRARIRARLGDKIWRGSSSNGCDAPAPRPCASNRRRRSARAARRPLCSRSCSRRRRTACACRSRSLAARAPRRAGSTSSANARPRCCALKRVPDGVRLDPGLRVWRALDPGQLPPILRRWILARTPRLALASSGAAMARAAQALAQALFENPAHMLDLAEIPAQGDPVLLVGLNADVDAALARLGLPPRPKALAGRGSAQVWTVRRADNAPPVAVVSVRDAAALLALQRPLPHYGAQSFLVFEGAHAVTRGVWPAPGRRSRSRVKR